MTTQPHIVRSLVGQCGERRDGATTKAMTLRCNEMQSWHLSRIGAPRLTTACPGARHLAALANSVDLVVAAKD